MGTTLHLIAHWPVATITIILVYLLYTAFVSGSVARGLIDLKALHVAGDGTHLRTWANAHRHKCCPCDNRNKPRSEPYDCVRRFHDPLAPWGWDSYRERYVYGHGVYELTAYSLQHSCQLSLVVNVLDNHRHDSVAYLAAAHEAVGLLGFHLAIVSPDKAHDAMALYRLGVEHWHLDSVIPLPARLVTGNQTTTSLAESASARPATGPIVQSSR